MEAKSNEELEVIENELRQTIAARLKPLLNSDALIVMGMIVSCLLGTVIACGPKEFYNLVLERAAKHAKELCE